MKLIDVYPGEVAAQPEMGGYQLMISADIFRGRYRESLESPKPIKAGSSCLDLLNPQKYFIVIVDALANRVSVQRGPRSDGGYGDAFANAVSTFINKD